MTVLDPQERRGTGGALLAMVLVRQLHSERRFNGDGYGYSVCVECRQAWPCATEEAIAGALALTTKTD